MLLNIGVIGGCWKSAGIKDKVSNTNVLKRIREKEPRFHIEISQQKLAYVGHVLRGSGGRNALVILVEKK